MDDRFELDQTAGHVTYDNKAVGYRVERIRVVAHDTSPRHTFIARGKDGSFIQVSWNPEQPDTRVQSVWIETSMDPGLFILDRAGEWSQHATGRAPTPLHPTRYLPRRHNAADAHQLLETATRIDADC